MTERAQIDHAKRVIAQAVAVERAACALIAAQYAAELRRMQADECRHEADTGTDTAPARSRYEAAAETAAAIRQAIEARANSPTEPRP